jgi:nicotinamidase-related amidase
MKGKGLKLMKNTALIIVDIQNDYFPGGKFEQEGANDAADNAAKAIAEFRAREMPIIHIRHENLSDSSGFFMPGSEGVEIHDSVAPVDGEKVITKNYPNSFRGTDLEQELQALVVQRVVITGMMTLMCIDATSRAANDLGLEVIVLSDACAARALEFDGVEVSAVQVHAAFLAALQMFYADIKSTDAFIETL